MGTTALSSRPHSTLPLATSRPPPPVATRATPPPPAAGVGTGHPSGSTFEAGPAARVEARGHLEGTLSRCGTDAAVSRRVLGRIDRLPEADQPRERAMLERAATGPNGARAVQAYDALARRAAASPEAARRLTPDIREALVRGVSESRTSDARGTEGVLGVHQATTAADALVQMPRARYDEVSTMLSQAGTSHAASPQADPQAERALILDAVAARAPALSRRGAAGDSALEEVRGFAADVRGLPREELIATTTALDLDSTRSTSATDPEHPTHPGDTSGTNDGLNQRYTDSCAPTVAQMERAELDPVYARTLHREGLSSPSTSGSIAEEQRRTLEAGRGRAVSLEATEASRDAVGRLGTALETAHTSPEERHRIGTYLRGTTRGTTELAQAAVDLDTLRARSGGAPTREDIAAIRAQLAAPRSRGMVAEDALTRIAGSAAHGRYTSTSVPSSGLSAHQSDDMARRITRGDDVGIRVSDAAGTQGHLLLATDVRGTGADRSYLVSDPSSGRTAWIPDAELRTPGTEAYRREFGVSWDRMSDYVHTR